MDTRFLTAPSIFLQDYFKVKKYIKYFTGTTQINSWKSNGMSPTLVYHYLISDINIIGHCLISNNISIPKKVINLYISYILNPYFRNLSADFTLKNCLCKTVKLTKKADPDKYKYSSNDIRFVSRSEFSFTDESMGKNIEGKCLTLELT